MKLEEILRLEIAVEEQEGVVAAAKRDVKTEKEELRKRVSALRTAIAEIRSGQARLPFDGKGKDASRN